ncbi:MAG: sigma-70 family RNA polymerase sigma factor, partial [Treponema sp.]|nr:sigma-70 family RNA polymerase sigma factor [Treponema sp.]
AAQKFDYTRNVKFITYAAFWIRDSIQKALFANGKAVRIPSHRSDLFYSQQYAASSLDAPVGAASGENEGNASFADFLVDPVTSSFDDQICEEDQADKVRQAVSSLPEMECKVITKCFGLDGKGEKSYRQIAEEFSCSHETVRTYANKALAALRKCA